jgi:hypothetical protein
MLIQILDREKIWPVENGFGEFLLAFEGVPSFKIFLFAYIHRHLQIKSVV